MEDTSETATDDRPTLEFDEWLTERNNQRVWLGACKGRTIKVFECLQMDLNNEDLYAKLPPEVATPHYSIKAEGGFRPATNDVASFEVCEIVLGFENVEDGAVRLIERLEGYIRALGGE